MRVNLLIVVVTELEGGQRLQPGVLRGGIARSALKPVVEGHPICNSAACHFPLVSP